MYGRLRRSPIAGSGCWITSQQTYEAGYRAARARARVTDHAARDCAAAKSSRPSRQITASPSKTVPGRSSMPTTARSIQCWVTMRPDRAYKNTVSSLRRSTVL
ncbi:hypothetical protein GCM10010207_80270 [Streptomyces atratus]|nr:hypothetical protein GCM10010207_80270 [Streptomyces atratus]